MRGAVRQGSAPDAGTDRTLEEQLLRAHDQLCLVADVFDLQAVAPDAAGLSAAACAALSALYRHASQELRATLPAALLNWEGVAARLRAHGRPLPVGSDAGSPEDITTTWFVDVDRVSEVDRSEAPRCR